MKEHCRHIFVTFSSQFRHIFVTFSSHFRDIFVTSCDNLAILKASPTKLCHYTNQNIASLTVQKNPVKFLTTQHFRHISIFYEF